MNVLIKSVWMTLKELHDEYPDLYDQIDFRKLLVMDVGHEGRSLYRVTVESEKEVRD